MLADWREIKQNLLSESDGRLIAEIEQDLHYHWISKIAVR